MSKPIVKKFWCDVYNVNILLVAGCSVREFKQILKRRKYSTNTYNFNYNAIGEAIEWDNSFTVYIRDRKNLGTIVHETLHLAMMILGRAGCDVGVRCSEHEHVAYYQGYWFEKIRKTLK